MTNNNNHIYFLVNGYRSEKSRHVKNTDKFKKYILRGQRNVRYHEKTLPNEKKSYNLT